MTVIRLCGGPFDGVDFESSCGELVPLSELKFTAEPKSGSDLAPSHRYVVDMSYVEASSSSVREVCQYKFCGTSVADSRHVWEISLTVINCKERAAVTLRKRFSFPFAPTHNVELKGLDDLEDVTINRFSFCCIDGYFECECFDMVITGMSVADFSSHFIESGWETEAVDVDFSQYEDDEGDDC